MMPLDNELRHHQTSFYSSARHAGGMWPIPHDDVLALKLTTPQDGSHHHLAGNSIGELSCCTDIAGDGWHHARGGIIHSGQCFAE